MNTKACKTLRPCEHLYALPETIECALHGCTPCSYKLVVKAVSVVLCVCGGPGLKR